MKNRLVKLMRPVTVMVAVIAWGAPLAGQAEQLKKYKLHSIFLSIPEGKVVCKNFQAVVDLMQYLGHPTSDAEWARQEEYALSRLNGQCFRFPRRERQFLVPQVLCRSNYCQGDTVGFVFAFITDGPAESFERETQKTGMAVVMMAPGEAVEGMIKKGHRPSQVPIE